MKRPLILALFLTLAMQLGVFAAPLMELGSERGLGSMTNVTAAVPATSTAITLTAPVRHVIIATEAGAARIYIRFDGGTATTANFSVAPGGALTVDGLPLVTTVTIIGASAAGNDSLLAW